MIGIDTNILIRWLIDDPAAPGQADRARELIEQLDEPAMVAIPVIAETVWLARRTFRLGKTEIIRLVEVMLASPSLIVAERASVEQALEQFRVGNIDLTDHLIAALNRASGCKTTLTFDRAAARNPAFTLLT